LYSVLISSSPNKNFLGNVQDQREVENEAAKYCDLLQGGAAEVKVAEIEASSVRNRAIFRSGTVFEKLEY
jgi:hypothetical protein